MSSTMYHSSGMGMDHWTFRCQQCQQCPAWSTGGELCKAAAAVARFCSSPWTTVIHHGNMIWIWDLSPLKIGFLLDCGDHDGIRITKYRDFLSKMVVPPVLIQAMGDPPRWYVHPTIHASHSIHVRWIFNDLFAWDHVVNSLYVACGVCIIIYHISHKTINGLLVMQSLPTQ